MTDLHRTVVGAGLLVACFAAFIILSESTGQRIAFAVLLALTVGMAVARLRNRR